MFYLFLDWEAMTADQIFDMIIRHQEMVAADDSKAKQVTPESALTRDDEHVSVGTNQSEATDLSSKYAKRNLSAFKDCKLPSLPISA